MNSHICPVTKSEILSGIVLDFISKLSLCMRSMDINKHPRVKLLYDVSSSDMPENETCKHQTYCKQERKIS